MSTLVDAPEDVGEQPDGDTPVEDAPRPLLPGWLVTVSLVGIVAVGFAARLWSRSPLWLDEALTVNISKLSLGDMFEALRHDGHPPLYYVLLHFWMQAFGSGDVAVRLLSAVFAVAALPLAWVAGRRIAGVSGARWALVAVALSPYCIRYATETRMYSLVMLLILAGWLVMDDLLKKGPTWPRLAGVAVVSGLLLLSHYWSFWLLGSIGLLLLWRWWRSPGERGTTVRAIGAVAAGAILFLPWLPAFLYQSAHTGTPWGKPFRPTAAAAITLADMAGGLNFFDGYLGATLIAVLVLLALFVARTAAGGNEVVLDVRTVPLVRRELIVAGMTFLIGIAVGLLTAGTYQSRYAAVLVPLLLLAMAAGVAVLPERARLVAGVALIGTSVMGIGWTEYYQRTQSADVADQVAARAKPGDLVVYCPDQLGPGYSREMPSGLEHRPYPGLGSPKWVDWVDYAKHQERADPRKIGAKLRAEAAGHSIFMVWINGYLTYGTQCQDLLGTLSKGHDAETLVEQDQDKFYEPAYLTWIKP